MASRTEAAKFFDEEIECPYCGDYYPAGSSCRRRSCTQKFEKAMARFNGMISGLIASSVKRGKKRAK